MTDTGHNPKPFGVIFDVDGVLIDSGGVAYRVRSRILAEHGVDMADVPDPYHEDHKGNSLKYLLEEVEQRTGVAIDETAFADEATASMRQDFKGVTVDPVLLGLLKELKHHGIPCGIASSGRDEGVRLKLEILGIQDYFAQIVTAQDVTRHKPDPEIYELAARRLGLAPERCLVIEDSTAGVMAGTAAGCTVVGFTRFSKTKQPFEPAGITIDSWDELPYSQLAALLQ